MFHVKLKANVAENTMQAITLPFYTPTDPRWGQKVKTLFPEIGPVTYQIKGTDLYKHYASLTFCTPLIGQTLK